MMVLLRTSQQTVLSNVIAWITPNLGLPKCVAVMPHRGGYIDQRDFIRSWTLN
jgi:hypothetical protein